MRRGKKVIGYNRHGIEYLFASISAVAHACGVSFPTVRARLEDGNWLFTDNGTAIKVRWAECKSVRGGRTE